VSRRTLDAVLTVLIAIGADQVIKLLVVRFMALGESIEILPFLALFHARNEGIAFSMLNNFHGWGLAAISAAVLLFVFWLWRNTPADRRLANFGFALIVGGAVGNLIDRVSLGYVVDYILFHTPVWSFAVFNLADSFISIGAVLILIDEVVLSRRRATPDEDARPAGDAR
jgi:signal peptidase II